ncbi:hypothetical protein V1512DRAFT_272942 [Lipomyces arxii]|uniref:uncharacterized protein n=1 Tax=Lipomyces arxii TaxID=56418 RepID=UPI0034CF52D7
MIWNCAKYAFHQQKVFPIPNSVDAQKVKALLGLKGSTKCEFLHATNDDAERFNATNSFSNGTYANGYETSYIPGAEDVVLMIKSGATVLWQRLPIHLATTLPQVPHFYIYSDAPDVIAGIPVIDILSHTSKKLRQSDDFRMYKQQEELLSEHSNIELYDSRAHIEGAWNLDKFKNIPMIAHAYNEHPTAKWYIFMDADSYILWPNMIRWLQKLNHKDKLYIGSVAIYLKNHERFAHGGSGVIMSSGLLSQTFGKEPELAQQYEDYTKENCCGDHILAHAFLDRDVAVISADGKVQGEPPESMWFNSGNWCHEVMTFHHLTVHGVERLYEFEKEFYYNTPILYKDVYRKFVMPYLDPKGRKNWDNLADTRQYSADREKDTNNPTETAYESAENCAQKCDEWSSCLQYRYKPGYCGISDSVRIGAKDTSDNVPYTSAWLIERIRNLRNSKSCDEIGHGVEEGSAFSDG